ncbi:MAG: hypothetical protein K9N10_09295 [Deltaproteobacteria bacterium]|nr:hypothetical protein [Deltaproteobacteria bacterium]
MKPQKVMIEIVAKEKGCMLCDLALAILEEIAPEFERGLLQWKVVDVGSREGIERQAELKGICGRMPSVPSIVINDRIAFGNIPEMEALSNAVRQAIYTE